MAHLWLPKDEGAWGILPLKTSPLSLERLPPTDIHREGDASPESVTLRALRSNEDGWALVAGARRRVYVNGLALRSGLHILRDRDEIRLDHPPTSGGLPSSSRVFFSSERLARREPFPGAGSTFFCPRCKTKIAPGMPAVKCPFCGVWHHAIPEEERDCWSHTDRCASCERSTNSTELSWTPDDWPAGLT